jgi:3-keto-disaccharide hydrolase
MRIMVTVPLLVSLFALVCLSAAAQDQSKTYTDPKKVDEDYAYQGEYTGQRTGDNGDVKLGVQIIALGDGKFHAVGYRGGLPGEGWDNSEKREADGERRDGKLTFTDGGMTATVEKGEKIVLTDESGSNCGELKKVERRSPTLGKKPPAGAVVLFDGKSTEALLSGRKTEDGLLMQGATSKQKFGNHSVHIEFRLPYMPYAREQARGNSGIYLQSRYEVQMLDSFGLEGKNNECGGIYTIAEPKVNMCLPPLVWQTYDIDYTAAQFDGGKKVKSARMTVRHNGVLIHDNVELTHATTAAPLGEGPEPGPVYLQDHGTPVRYRNIWVVERKE